MTTETEIQQCPPFIYFACNSRVLEYMLDNNVNDKYLMYLSMTSKEIRKILKKIYKIVQIEIKMNSGKKILKVHLSSEVFDKVEQKNLFEYRDSQGKSIIHLLAEAGHYECLEQLLKEYPEININVKTKGPKNKQWTPLHYAIYSGRIEIIKMLLDKGASVDEPLYNDGLLKSSNIFDFIDKISLTRINPPCDYNILQILIKATVNTRTSNSIPNNNECNIDEKIYIKNIDNICSLISLGMTVKSIRFLP